MAVYRSYPDHASAALPKEKRTLLRNAVTGLLFLLLSSLLAACGSVMPAATTELDSVKLQLNWVHSSDFAGFYVADAKGFYADENLSVEFLERDNDVPSRQKLVNGEADFALLSLNRISDLIEEGANPVGLSATFQISPNVFFALKESGILHPRDLAGKKVGIKSNSWRERVHGTLEQIGVDPSEIVEVEVDFDAMDLLYDGTVDVWTGFINEEVVAARNQGYDVDLIFPADYAIGDYEAVITQLESDRLQDPALAERFVRASLRGWEYTIQNPEEAAEIMTTWNDQHDLDFYQAAIHELVPLVDTGQVPIGWIDGARWQRELSAQGATPDEAAGHYNLEALLSIPANRSWFATVKQ